VRQVQREQHAELADDVVAAGEGPRQVDEDRARAQVVGDEAGPAEHAQEQREHRLPDQERAEELAVDGEDAPGLREPRDHVDLDDPDHERTHAATSRARNQRRASTRRNASRVIG
jgi:hypothetical protein